MYNIAVHFYSFFVFLLALRARQNTACRTRKNMQRYCTPKHPIRYIYIHRYGYGNSFMLCYVMLSYVMLCYVMLCYVMLCYVMLCYVMLCYVMLCYVMLCYVMLCYVMLCYVMLCYVMLCYVMLCYVMLCYVMLCYVMLYVCCTSIKTINSCLGNINSKVIINKDITIHDKKLLEFCWGSEYLVQ